MARAMQRRFEAQALAVTQRVATVYWELWRVRTTRTLHRDHLEVVRGLSESARARLSTGKATLAELQQIDLAAARLEDDLHGLDEEERGAEARLRASIGVAQSVAVPTTADPGEARLPAEPLEKLVDAVRNHPMVESLGWAAEASAAQARAEAAQRWPSFTVGVDWIVTGEATTASVPDSGRDAVVVGAGLRVRCGRAAIATELRRPKRSLERSGPSSARSRTGRRRSSSRRWPRCAISIAGSSSIDKR